MSNLFFTSDHHFGHRNIIRYAKRPFSSVEEMNEVMIERWNAKVQPQDSVFYLGDFALCPPKETENILAQLNGRICLIKGNHERSALACKKHFTWIKDYYELKVPATELRHGRHLVVLCHYALRVWRSHHHGAFHLYGHSHGSLEELPDQRCLDIGVDCHDFYPLAWEEVLEKMEQKAWVPPFANEKR